MTCPVPTNPTINLCGTSIKVNGQLTQLNYASKTQVNFLMPDVSGSVSIEVANRDGVGTTVTLPVQAEIMSLFSQSGNGKGLVAALHWTTPGIARGTVVTMQNPAQANYPLIVYASGLGNYSSLSSKPTVKINRRVLPANLISSITYTNGQYQINIDRLPLVDLNISSTGTYSIQLCGGSICGNVLNLPVQYLKTTTTTANTVLAKNTLRP